MKLSANGMSHFTLRIIKKQQLIALKMRFNISCNIEIHFTGLEKGAKTLFHWQIFTRITQITGPIPDVLEYKQ